MELKILNAFLVGREYYDKIVDHINPKDYSQETELLIGAIGRYYAKDPNAGSVDVDLLLEQVSVELKNDKHRPIFQRILDNARNCETSAPNVEQLIISIKRKEAAEKLSTALVNGKYDDADAYMEDYRHLRSVDSLDEALGKEGIKVVPSQRASEMIAQETAQGPSRGFIKVYPKVLGMRLDDGIVPGTHIVVYGVPEIGKSALAISIACGFLRQGLPGLYIENEEAVIKTRERFRSNLSKMDKWEIRADPNWADDVAFENGFGLATFVDAAGESFRDIEDLIAEFKPKWFVVNQIHNVYVKAENEVLRRERAAQNVRRLAKKYGAIGISVTQADDSADGVPFLAANNVYFNNTGIPGSADIMIGVGADPGMLERGERGISLPKNKVNDNHDQFIVRLIPQLSRIEGVE